MPRPDLLQLAPSLYRLRIPGTRAHLLNCYLWVDDAGVTPVDTGWPDSADLIAAVLTAASDRIATATDAFADV